LFSIRKTYHFAYTNATLNSSSSSVYQSRQKLTIQKNRSKAALFRQQLLLHQQPQIERRNGVGLPRCDACLNEVGAGEYESDVAQLLHYGFSSASWMIG